LLMHRRRRGRRVVGRRLLGVVGRLLLHLLVLRVLVAVLHGGLSLDDRVAH
jgi:hypothetical protein